MMTSMATRMALDLDLPKAYHDLTMSALSSRGDHAIAAAESGDELFRKARVWFGTFVLEHMWVLAKNFWFLETFGDYLAFSSIPNSEWILTGKRMSLDCGKKPGVVAVDGMRRCRVLLGHPSMIPLDLRLMSQVEVWNNLLWWSKTKSHKLNSIRALAHERLSSAAGTTLSDQELSEIIQGTRIDLNIWLKYFLSHPCPARLGISSDFHSDWITLIETHAMSTDERESLLINLRIQKDWAEMTMLCKGLQGIGDNVA